MEIVRATSEGGFVAVGRICDRCGFDVRLSNPDLGAMWAYQEFLTVQFRAGYGAEHFLDDDEYRCELCERCVCEVLGRYLRHTPNRDQELLIAGLQSGRVLSSLLGDV